MSLTHGPLVSVVTPAYNCERELPECIESVRAQTYTHWDYTIVDNRSTDRTLAIARSFAEQDPRIRVVTNDLHVRVIANHNIAFRQISPESKYCKMVQADDCLMPDCLQKMVSLAEAHPAVVIVGSYGLAGPEVVWVGVPYPTTVMRGRDACRMTLLGGPYAFGTPTSVLFRSDIVRSRHAFYNESNIHADTEACLEFLEFGDFGFVHQILHFIRLRPNTLTPFSLSRNTGDPARLDHLLRHGPKYLNDAEMKTQIKKLLRHYYRHLGRECFRSRGREYWAFHRDRLASLGYPLSTTRLAAAAISRALNIVLNPKSGIEATVRRLSQRYAGRSPRK